MNCRPIENSGFHISTDFYKLDLRGGNCAASLQLRNSTQRYAFYPSGAVDADRKIDESAALSFWQQRELTDGLEFFREEKSVLWKKKSVHLLCRENSIELYLVVEGRGAVDDIRFCRGCFDGAEYGFAGEFDEIFDTAPNFYGKMFYHPVERVTISHGNNLDAEMGGQALATCLSCFGLRDRTENLHLVAGVAALPGEYTWDDFVWNPPVQMPPTTYIGDQMKAGGFAITYEGKKNVEGSWETPHFLFTFANVREEVLPQFISECVKRGFLKRLPPKNIPAWWRDPIYCTWHDQCAAAMLGEYSYIRHNGAHARDFCTEELVEEWINTLCNHNCKPGIVILDDRWQLNLNDADPDPECFRDMRSWIDKCHRRGIKVFLWTAAWNNDNIPEDQAITRDGKVVCGDITNPVYEARFREMVRKMLSSAPDSLNADGIKMDGLLGLPIGRGLKNHDNLWGAELQKRFLSVLYDEAKKAKSDSCVSTFVAHPLMAEYSDMVRLADMYHARLNTERAMLHRAEVYNQCTPYSVIDTDGQFFYSVETAPVALLEFQSKLGVPSLYTAKLLRQERFFQPVTYREITEKEYKGMAKALEHYRKNVGIK